MPNPTPKEGKHDDLYTRQQSTLRTLAGVATIMAGVESQIFNLTHGLDPGKLRTVSMSLALLAVINVTCTSLYSTVMQLLYHKFPDQKRNCHGSTDDEAKETKKGMVGGALWPLWVKNPESVDGMIKWCGTLLVIGTCAGFIALFLYFFASSSLGVGIFVVVLVFAMGVCPLIWSLYRISCHPEQKKSHLNRKAEV